MDVDISGGQVVIHPPELVHATAVALSDVK